MISWAGANQPLYVQRESGHPSCHDADKMLYPPCMCTQLPLQMHAARQTFLYRSALHDRFGTSLAQAIRRSRYQLYFLMLCSMGGRTLNVAYAEPKGADQVPTQQVKVSESCWPH